jgi:hypothetical protein
MQHTQEATNEDGFQEKYQANTMHAQGESSEATGNGSDDNNMGTTMFTYRDFRTIADLYDTVVDVSMVDFIFRPHICTICQKPTFLLLPTHWSQRICDRCQISLSSDASLSFLHEISAKIYAFWLTLRREEFCDRVHKIVLPGLPTHYGFNKGDPENRTTPPDTTNVDIPNSGTGIGTVSHTLSAEQRNLLEEVLLTNQQCHISLLVLKKLIEKIVSATNSPILEVYELSFNPKHIVCSSHCVYVFKLTDKRRFVVSFTDRQLGWYPLVVPWEEYRTSRIDSIPQDEDGQLLMFELGYVYEENTYVLRRTHSLSKDENKKNGITQRIRGLEMADKVVRRWEEWLEKETGAHDGDTSGPA